MLSCQRCKQTTNGPQTFLLTCRGCSRTWHHRCHMPPVEDAELFQRLRATNDQDMANGIHAWACRRCKKGTSGTPSATSGGSGGGPTVSSASLDDKKSLTSGDSPAAKDTRSASAVSVAPPGAKVKLSTVVDAPNDRERNKTGDRMESVDEAPVKHTPIDKRAAMAARKLPHVQTQPGPTSSRDTDVEMTTELTPQEERRSLQNLSRLPSRRVSGARKVAGVDTGQDLSKTLSRRVSGARKVVNMDTAPPIHSEDDVEMADDATMISTFSESTPGTTLQVPQTSSSDNQLIGLKSTAEVQPDVRAASSSSSREQEVRPADEVAIQPQGNQDAYVDDPEDLYGPPVERRIIRILPSLAEELREQRRLAAVQKEKKLKRAYLAPDWIFAKYANDPLWKEVPTANEPQKPRKAPTRKLGENGLNVNELVGCFTAANWVREHIDKT